MSGENREEISQPSLIDDRTPSEIEYDQQMDRLDSLFSSLDPGVTLLIQRLQPSWCKGVLEEITIGDDEVNLDYFIENWGGHLLLVKIRGSRGRMQGNYKIPLYSYPPMVYGKRLKYNDKSERFTDETEAQAPNTAQSPVVVNQGSSMEKLFQVLPTVLPLVSEMMKANEARRQADMAMMLSMMKSQNGSGLSDITKVGAVMSQLSEMFRNNNPEISNPGEMDFMGNALDVIKTVFSNKQDVPPQQNHHKLIPPKVGPAPSPGPAVPSSNVVTPINTSNTSQNTKNIAQSISMMDAKEAADTIIEAMCRMPSSKRDDAIGNFIAQYQADMGDMGADNEVEDGDDYAADAEESRGRRR